MSAQEPLELILARNLLSQHLDARRSLSARVALLLFYNEAAAAMLGRRFEELGSMPAERVDRRVRPVRRRR